MFKSMFISAMVPIIDGNLEIGAHVWSEIDFFILNTSMLLDSRHKFEMYSKIRPVFCTSAQPILR